MSQRALISAVIPTYNREKTVGRAIDSIVTQSYPAAEILVVDDGSNDGTRNVLSSYKSSVRYVYQANQGVAVARNHLVWQAKYDWIAFLDSDDYWLPDHLKRIADAIERTKGEGALYFSDVIRPPNQGGGSLWKCCQFNPHSPCELVQDAGDWVLLQIQPMMLQASVIRRDKYLDCGGLPSALRTREDTLLFYKLGLLYPACAVVGCGAVITSDGDARLTTEMNSATIEYSLATISMFKAVAALGNAVSAERRRVILWELSAAYFGAGRVLFHRRKMLKSIVNLLHSGILSPKVFVRCFLQKFRRCSAPGGSLLHKWRGRLK